MTSADYELEIILLPMIHIGEKQYNDKVKKCLEGCSQFLYEGVPGTTAKFITASYKLLTYRKDLGLVCQSDYLSRKDFSGKAIHADYDQQAVNESSKNLTFFQKYMLMAIAPCYGIYRYFTATRSSLAKRLTIDDLKSRKETLQFEDHDELESFIHSEPDKKIYKSISDQLDKVGKGRLGILYGAGHMGSIVNYLREMHDFKVSSSEWLTVFSH